MSAAKICFGVFREVAHSPGRIDDDAAILKSVGAALAERGFGVELVTADALFEISTSQQPFCDVRARGNPRSPGDDGEGGLDGR